MIHLDSQNCFDKLVHQYIDLKSIIFQKDIQYFDKCRGLIKFLKLLYFGKPNKHKNNSSILHFRSIHKIEDQNVE